MLTSNHTTLLQPTPKVNNNKNNANNNNNAVFNLERILQQYASQPDLLELILSSKVEEDRRRAEEAKLKNKEIDYLLQQQKLSPKENQSDNHHTIDNKCQDWRYQQSQHQQKLPSLSPPPSTTLSSSSTTTTTSSPSSSSLGKRSSSIEWTSNPTIILPPLTSPPMSHKSSSPRLSSHDINYKNSIQHITSPSSMTELSFDGIKKEDSSHYKKLPISPLPSSTSHSFQAPPSPPNDDHENGSHSFMPCKKSSVSSHHKRRRREMQPVTAIIETREFPYNDNYLWRNNGNTIHKKTGFKSIYYKCANSQQVRI
ncbi:unnamed protein product [Cunninghamella blakesleeana]